MAREHYLAASALSPPHPTRAAAAVAAADMALALGDAGAAAREYEAALGLAGLTESLRQAAERHGALTLTLTPTLTLTLTLTLIPTGPYDDTSFSTLVSLVATVPIEAGARARPPAALAPAMHSL